MKTFPLYRDYQKLSAEATAALRRFAWDVKLICSGSTRTDAAASPGELQALAISAYRTALLEATGRPYDFRWVFFASAVAALVMSAAPDISCPDIAAATSRLNKILNENADLLG